MLARLLWLLVLLLLLLVSGSSLVGFTGRAISSRACTGSGWFGASCDSVGFSRPGSGGRFLRLLLLGSPRCSRCRVTALVFQRLLFEPFSCRLALLGV